MANLRRKISNSKTSTRQLSSRKSRTNSKLLDKKLNLEESKPKKSTKKSNSKTKLSSKKETKKQKPIVKKKPTKKSKKIDSIKNYSCVWRMETVENSLTNEKYRKRVWIVIGDGDKKYRKFDSQAEAISYFRSLKKHAEMKVQSISSKRFIRIVYTLFDMQQKGIDINEVKKNKNKLESKIKNPINDDVDFEDEYSRFDTVEFNNFNDEEEIDAALAKSLEYSVYIEDTNTNYIDTNTLENSAIDKYDDEDETIEVPQKDFSTELVVANEDLYEELEENHKTFYLKEDNNYKNEIIENSPTEESPLKINSPTEIYSFTKDVNYLEPLQKPLENNEVEQLSEAIVINSIDSNNNNVEESSTMEKENQQEPSLTELYAITKDMNLETKPSSVSASVNMDVEPVTVYEKPKEFVEDDFLKTPKQHTEILKRVDNKKSNNVGKVIVVVISVIVLLLLLALIGYLVWELFFKGK